MSSHLLFAGSLVMCVGLAVPTTCTYGHSVPKRIILCLQDKYQQIHASVAQTNLLKEVCVWQIVSSPLTHTHSLLQQ